MGAGLQIQQVSWLKNIIYKVQNKQTNQARIDQVMGNKSNQDQLTTLHQNWITTTQPQSQLLPNINLYRSRLLINTITHDYIEEYLVHFISEEDYQHYIKQTSWRQGLEHRDPMAYILPIRAFINTSSSELCTTSHTACIYFDKVQMRLTDINDIPFADAMYMLRVCLEGFGMLKEHFGLFSIAEDMVFINEEGEVKVWIHANLSSVIPNREQKYFIGSEKQTKKQYQTPLTKNQKTTNTKQLHEQSYNTQNSYQNSYKYPQPFGTHENTYTIPEISQESMVNDILGMVEENIDKQTMGGQRLFSEYVKDRARNPNSGNETSRNRGPRGNVINSRYTENQGSQKLKNKKTYTFASVLQLYKQYIQQHNINAPRRMQVIHNIYQNKQGDKSATPNFNADVNVNVNRNDSSSNSNSHSNNSNKNSLHNSQTVNQQISNNNNNRRISNTNSIINNNNNPTTTSNNNNNNNNNNMVNRQKYPTPPNNRYSSGQIITPPQVSNQNLLKINTADNWKQHNNSLFEGKFDESAVTHIGNKIQNKLSLDTRNTGTNKYAIINNSNTPTPTNNNNNNNNNTGNINTINTINTNSNINNNSNISYNNRSQLNDSLNIVQINGNLQYNLYSTSNVTTIFPINNRNSTSNHAILNSNNIKSLNNSRMNNNLIINNTHINNTNTNSNLANNNNNSNTNTNSNTHTNTNINTNANTNTNTIYNAIKIKNKNNNRIINAQNRRLATEGTDYANNRSVSKNAHNISSHPFAIENNTARSRNSSIEVNNKLTQHQSHPYQQPLPTTILNYTRLQNQHNNTPTHSSQNSSITSTSNNLNQIRNKINVVNNVRVNPLAPNSTGMSTHINNHVNNQNNQKKQSEDKMIKYHSPLSTLLEEKYDHGSKIIRTNHNNLIHNNINPHIKNGYYRHTSNQSTKIEAKLTSINSNTNINAIKYVKTPYITINNRQDLQHNNSPLITKPNSVNIGPKNSDYIPSPAYVEKYIKDAHQPNSGVAITPVNPTSTNVYVHNNMANTNRQAHNQYHALNQTPYSVHRNFVQQSQQAQSSSTNKQAATNTREKGKQRSQDKQVRYYTSNETYELDSQIAFDLADVNEAEI